MNCKPGDMAIVINSQEMKETGLVDKLFKLKSIGGTTLNGHPYWTYEGPEVYCECGCGSQINGIGDNVLRPIRPGETPEESIEAMKKLHDLEKEKV